MKSARDLAISADDLLPLFSYVLIQSSPPHFESWLHMIENFLPESMSLGEGGYYTCIARIIIGSLMEAGQGGAGGRQRALSELPASSHPASFGTPHTVQFSETLAAIALSHDIPVETLAAANSMPEHLSLYPGQVVYIPTPPPSDIDGLLMDGIHLDPLGANQPSPPSPGGAAVGNPEEWWQ
jgi:hypothetical protein